MNYANRLGKEGVERELPSPLTKRAGLLPLSGIVDWLEHAPCYCQLVTHLGIFNA